MPHKFTQRECRALAESVPFDIIETAKLRRALTWLLQEQDCLEIRCRWQRTQNAALAHRLRKEMQAT